LKILGQKVEWQNLDYIELALTHRSLGKQNNERLEFLGDSILSLVISDYLYNKYPNLTEGELSRLRSQLVKGKTLAEVGRLYELGQQIKLGQGEIKSGGVNKSSVLADAVEAVFGAVLLDQGFDFASIYIKKVMFPWLEKINPDLIKKDAKSQLQEMLQQKGYELPRYKLLGEIEINQETEFRVLCAVASLNLTIEAKGSSIKKAEQSAASKMIDTLEQR
jgi:ribonuclease-3